MTTDGLSRRRFLQGVGATLALPLLPGLAWADDATGRPPRRLLFLFSPNGKHMPDWTPKRTGTDFELPYLLEPLAPYRDRLSVLSGLTLNGARALGDGPGDHARSAASFLTGAHPNKTAGSNIVNGVSVDQVAAAAIGGRTRLPSLELGLERGRQAGGCDSGYSCAYSSNVSWRSPRTPNGKEIHPRLVFERLFDDPERRLPPEERARRARYRSSILDLVGGEARDLRGRLGTSDARKLDEYLTSVRQMERRLEAAEAEREDLGDEIDVPPGIPSDLGEYSRLMYDLVVLAFRSDTTRIATLMLGNAGSNRSYPFLGIGDGHHYLSHHGGDRDKQAAIRKINRFHMEQLGHLLGALASVAEGDGTLLDSTLIVYGSGIADGNRHDHSDLPILLLGGPARSMVHNRYERETPLCNLYLSLLAAAGVRARSFGDSTGFLTDLPI